MTPEPLTLTLSLPPGALAVTAAPPELVSQRTAEVVLGIPKRAFLEALACYRAAGGVVTHLGRLRLVRREDFVRWLARREQASTETDGAAALAAELGLRAVGGGRP